MLTLLSALAYFAYSERLASPVSDSRRTGSSHGWLALLIGIAWTLPLNTYDLKWIAVRESLAPWAGAAYAGSLLPIFALLSRRARSGRVVMILLFASGCAVGIVIDTLIGPLNTLIGPLQNLALALFAIVYYWIVEIPFVIVGTLIGWWFRKPIEMAP
jgi:hypothetical protein